jgi:hypothetical protein
MDRVDRAVWTAIAGEVMAPGLVTDIVDSVDWQARLGNDVAAGRAFLREVLEGPIRFTPVQRRSRRGYAFEGVVVLGGLLAGIVDVSTTTMASPTGFEPVFWP